VGLRISRLRTLIDHPGTGAAERAAAQRMLDRILLRRGPGGGPAGDRVYGARYGRIGRHMSLAGIADMVRADIAFLQDFSTPRLPAELALRSPVREAPAGISYSVESPFDGSIVITVEGVPHEWGWVEQDGLEIVSPALQALADELAEIMNGYNHDGADIARRFFGSVRVGGVTLAR
jgi:hypothetical protein